MKKNLRL